MAVFLITGLFSSSMEHSVVRAVAAGFTPQALPDFRSQAN
jgi:hypothetical protein